MFIDLTKMFVFLVDFVCGDPFSFFLFRGMHAFKMFFAMISDINECTLNIDECDANAECTNNIGSYCCSCVDGYYGTGFNCSGNVVLNLGHLCGIIS